MLSKRSRVGGTGSSNKKQKAGGFVADDSFVGTFNVLCYTHFWLKIISVFHHKYLLENDKIGVELKAGRVERVYLD